MTVRFTRRAEVDLSLAVSTRLQSRGSADAASWLKIIERSLHGLNEDAHDTFTEFGSWPMSITCCNDDLVIFHRRMANSDTLIVRILKTAAIIHG